MKKLRVDVIFSITGPAEVDGTGFSVQDAFDSVRELFTDQFGGPLAEVTLDPNDNTFKTKTQADGSHAEWKISAAEIEEE